MTAEEPLSLTRIRAALARAGLVVEITNAAALRELYARLRPAITPDEMAIAADESCPASVNGDRYELRRTMKVEAGGREQCA